MNKFSLRISLTNTFLYMIKHLVSLTFICFLFACRSQNDKNSYANLIKGDWVGPKQNGEPVFSSPLFVCFEDSTYQNTSEQDTFKYEVRKDTLYLNKVDHDGHPRLNKFPIVKLTADSLVWLEGRKQEYTIRLSKVRAKNTIIPDTIRFASSAPNMYVEIDSSRNFRFHGGWHASLKGGFRGKISESQYNSIVNKIRNLPLDTLREYYEAPWTDDFTKSIAIFHNNKITLSAAYGHYQEPLELDVLFAKLLTVYTHVNLQPDPSLNEDYFIMNYNLMPPPNIFLVPKIVPGKR